MARFKILAEIYITGEDIKIERDAMMAVQEMLGAYDDMTETTSNTEIMINTIKSERVFDNREEQILIDSMRDRIGRLYKMSETYRDGDNKEAQMDCLAEKKEVENLLKRIQG